MGLRTDVSVSCIAEPKYLVNLANLVSIFSTKIPRCGASGSLAS